MPKENIEWTMQEDKKCVIRNVPCEIVGEEKVLDLNVSLKVTTLRDLMFDNELPLDVNYEDFKDIEF